MTVSFWSAKKSFFLLAIALCVITAFISLASCTQKSLFSDEIDEATGAFTLTAENAEAKTSVGTLGGGITLEEDQVIAIDSHLEKGSVDVRFLDASGNLALEYSVEEQGLNAYGMMPGEYSIAFVCTKNGTTGTITVAVVDEEAYAKANGDLQRAITQTQRWTKTDSLEEATEGAEFEEFSLPEPNTQLQNGPTGDWKIRYEHGRIEARGYTGAAELIVMKGIYAGDGDISGVDREYTYEWIRSINGMEVRCAGDTEGRASKTIWISGNYSYCILVHGQGDLYDTFGLSEEDIAALVNAIR